MKKLFTIFFFLFVSASLWAQNVELSNRLIKQYKEGQSNALKKDASIQHKLWLTPILKEVILNWNELTNEAKAVFKKYTARPVISGTVKKTESGNFVFHYTTNSGFADEDVNATDANSNSIPDYIDNLISKFTTINTKYHTTMGLTVPPSDGTNGGNAKYDIYISGYEAGDGVYGWVSPDRKLGDNENSATITETEAYDSYMVLRNNYEGFGDQNIALSVTAAHEYMHAVQFGYSGTMESWFMEVGATWSEEHVYSGYDDNFQYLSGVFDSPDVALNLEDGEVEVFDGHWYSAWIFAQYLTEKTNPNIMKKIYERCIQYYALDAIDLELKANWQSSLKQTFTNFSIANVLMTSNAGANPYTYNRANDYAPLIKPTYFYENGTAPFNFTGSDISWSSKTNGNNRLMRFSSDYFLLTATKDFTIIFSPSNTEVLFLLLKISPTSFAIAQADQNASITVNDTENWTKYVPIVVRFDGSVTTTTAFDYNFTIKNSLTSQIENNLTADLISVYPNPAVNTITIDVENYESYTLEIIDLTGKSIQRNKLTQNKIDVSSIENGIYFLNIFENNELVKTQKVIINH